jgi:NAD(P)-dependent dehydrogenase (short-subunit alcohol dehydrogenase family)
MSARGDELFSLRNKRILVTGGTRGIGLAISLRFARSGAAVIANFLRDEKSAQRLEAVAKEENLAITPCRADLTTDKGLEHLSSFLGEEPLCGLVHSAATGVHRSIDELTDRHFDWTFNVNLRAFFQLVKLVRKRLPKGSTILVISSWGALRALPHYSVVGASKGGLEAFARHLAAEVAPQGIRVNILTAGPVLTDAWKAIPDSELRIAEAIRRTPSGRLATAEEIAYGAQFLCSDAAAGVIGHTLIIDGGMGIVV